MGIQTIRDRDIYQYFLLKILPETLSMMDHKSFRNSGPGFGRPQVMKAHDQP